jgi:hypothetical protein
VHFPSKLDDTSLQSLSSILYPTTIVCECFQHLCPGTKFFSCGSTMSTDCQMNPYNAQNFFPTDERAVRQANVEHTLGSPLPSSCHHAPYVASVIETPHTQSPDADDNLQSALNPAVDTPEHGNSSNDSVDPSAAASVGLDNPRRPVININGQVAASLTQSLQSQQVPGQPNSWVLLFSFHASHALNHRRAPLTMPIVYSISKPRPLLHLKEI